MPYFDKIKKDERYPTTEEANELYGNIVLDVMNLVKDRFKEKFHEQKLGLERDAVENLFGAINANLIFHFCLDSREPTNPLALAILSSHNHRITQTYLALMLNEDLQNQKNA